jgi:hypothetical protein
MHLMASSKKAISANQLHRVLGVTPKTGWFMSHRVREAMRVLGLEPMGGEGQVVEIDETYIWQQEGHSKKLGARGSAHKNIVLTLVQRGGYARSFHVDSFGVADVVPLVREDIGAVSAI